MATSVETGLLRPSIFAALIKSVAQTRAVICPGGSAALKLVGETYASKAPGAFKGCAEYTDFRKMLEKGKAIDAVLVATPDHVHAAAGPRVETILRGLIAIVFA